MDVLQRINDVFQDLFEESDLAITRDTTAADVPGWDSLMHVRLMLAIEKEFQLRFASSEVATFKNVGDLVDAVTRKVNRPANV